MQENGNFNVILSAITYDFENIREACIALDAGKVNGKIVVKVGD